MTVITPSERLTTSQSPLVGSRLTIARLLWAVMTAMILLILIIGLPSYYRFFQDTFLKTDQVLQQINLPANLRAVYYTILDTTIILAFCVTAILIFVRRSTDSMAILMSVGLMSYIIISYYVAVALLQIHPEWKPLVQLVNSAGTLITVAVLYLFPDGRFVPTWSRWIILIFGVWAAIWVIAPNSVLDFNSWDDTPRSIGNIVIYGMGLAAQLYRYRYVSSPQQRQQTKWIIFGFFAAFIGFMVLRLPEVIAPSILEPTPANILFHVFRNTICRGSELLIPLTIAFSIFRYRLWDIDFIVNRSLIYGLLTVLLGVVFLGLIFVLQAVFQLVTGTGQSSIAAIIATICVVSLFTPTRNRLRRFVDRRFYNIEIDYEKPAPVATAPTTSKTNLGPYSGLEFVGRGGMAEVYKVMHPTLNHMVAIKILPASLLNETDMRKRFEREARMLSGSKHPNIVQVYEFGESAGTPYIVMEYINGEDLKDYLTRAGRLSLAQALPWLKDIASALDYAHGQQLVHRDIKPSNIMLERRSSDSPEIQRAVLMDFGIAKLMSSATQLTSGIIGTFDYMAPEQIQEAEIIDGRVDQYAFSVMLFQILTGRLPFVNSNPGALLLAHLTQPPPDPRQFAPDLPDSVTRILQRGLAKASADRYATVGDLVRDLESVLVTVG